MSTKTVKQHIILIDSSYTAFYRFFATLRWYSMANAEEFKELKGDATYDWMKNKVFIEKYEKMFLKSILDLVKKKVYNNSKIIFCMDTPKESLWRTELDCMYKGERADLSLKNNFKPTFAYTFDTMIPKFIQDNPNIKKLRIDKMEADDIIACICIHEKNINSNNSIILVSGDEDFKQLGREHLTFINYKSKKPLVLTEDEAILSLNTKLVMGDKSDCIKGIFPKGTKHPPSKELIEDNAKLETYIGSNNDAKKQYELNKKMIDFKNIPKKYFDKVIKEYNQL